MHCILPMGPGRNGATFYHTSSEEWVRFDCVDFQNYEQYICILTNKLRTCRYGIFADKPILVFADIPIFVPSL